MKGNLLELESPLSMKEMQGNSGKRIHLPTQETQEMRVLSLGQEDPLEEEMATCSTILAWKSPQIEEPVGYSPRVAKSQTRLKN